MSGTPAGIEVVESYRFTPDDLRLGARMPGISAFMRIRNGAFSLEAAIRSHMPHYDEIVAVYNRSTDETPDILARLMQEFGPRLRVFHYLPPVFPPGSAGHRNEKADSPLSLANYYNFALSRTRHAHVTKLDDDHVAMGEATARLVADVRAGRAANGEIAAFSGLNLARDAAGRLGILGSDPFAGNGDHWVVPLRPGVWFTKDRRFERLRLGGLKRRFHSICYWHLKALKPEFGYANYDLAQNPDSRYARRLAALEAERTVIDLRELARRADPRRNPLHRLALLGLPVPPRDRVMAERARMAARDFAEAELKALLERDPEMAPFAAQT
jgi:hypothetical protein